MIEVVLPSGGAEYQRRRQQAIAHRRRNYRRCMPGRPPRRGIGAVVATAHSRRTHSHCLKNRFSNRRPSMSIPATARVIGIIQHRRADCDRKLGTRIHENPPPFRVLCRVRRPRHRRRSRPQLFPHSPNATWRRVKPMFIVCKRRTNAATEHRPRGSAGSRSCVFGPSSEGWKMPGKQGFRQGHRWPTAFAIASSSVALAQMTARSRRESRTHCHA